MTHLYAYSLLPVLSIALLLFFTVTARPMPKPGLAIFCASIAAWTLTLLLIFFEATAPIAQRGAACGGFVVAAYMHLAWDFTGQKNYAIIKLAYVMAALFTAIGAFFPGILYDPLSLSAGPIFWPSMAAAVIGASLPLWAMARARRHAQPQRRRLLTAFMIAGVVMYASTWGNAVSLAYGQTRPLFLLLLLGAMLVIARVISQAQGRVEQKVLEHSLTYSSLTALVWAVFLCGVFMLLSGPAHALLTSNPSSLLFVLCMSAIAFEPLRRHALNKLAHIALPERAQADQLARALIAQEERTDQAERLAELGAFTSAIAHEVRNPLGVIGAHVKLLERTGTPQAMLDPIRAQLERASEFVDDLVNYGRPRPLTLRALSLADLLALGASTARQGRQTTPQELAIDFDIHPQLPHIEGDQAQLLQVLVILLDNAMLAGAARIRMRAARCQAPDMICLSVEDDGPGIPAELMERVFLPFVTGRAREPGIQGTGLGLAIAHRIVERHSAHIEAKKSAALGGARFDIMLPVRQPIPGASPAPEPTP